MPLNFFEFSLVTSSERIAWRDALAKNMLAGSRGFGGQALTSWKKQEQLSATRLSIALSIEDGIVDPYTILENFKSRLLEERACEQQMK